MDRNCLQCTRGFSLIELLFVIAIMSALTGVGVATFSGNSARVSTGGNLVADLASQARQNSLSKGVMTALVMAKTTSTATSNYRAFALVEKVSGTSNWTPVTRWNHLPQGIAVDPSGSDNFINNTPQVLTPELPSIAGTQISAADCAFQVFLPDGRLSTKGITTTVSPTLRINEETKTGASGGNYYEIIINPLTGTFKVERP